MTTKITNVKITPSVAELLRAVCTHLVDHGKIEMGTPQSKMLIDAARAAGAWSADKWFKDM